MTEDKWSRWLKEERWGSYREAVQSVLNAVRDRILALADPQPGERVIDLGAGTGLLGLEAVGRVGPDGTVVCIDVSRDALRTLTPDPSHVGGRGEDKNEAAKVHCVGGDALHVPLADGCADAVVMRSVLIYIPDRPAAAREIARILRPGGRFACYEPINRRMPQVVQLPGFEDADAAWAAGMDLNSLTNFDEDDLVAAFREAGFSRVEMEMDESRFPVRGREWAHGIRHGAPGGYSGYDMLLMGGLSAERADAFIAAGERHLGDEWRVITFPAAYITAVR